MDAATKNRQNHNTLVKMIQKAFGEVGEIQPEQIKEMEGGFCNIVYLITLMDGREYVLKIAPADEVSMMSYEYGLLETEVAVLELVKERTTIKAPVVVFYDNSREICKAPYFFMTKIEGESLEQIKDLLSEEEKGMIHRTLGTIPDK